MSLKKPEILYVDDEVPNLEVFQMAFMDDFNIHTAESAQEALGILESHPIEVLLTDQKMPKKSGLELLEEVHEKYPEVISILITGYGDLEMVKDAVNLGKIYYFFEKPWDDGLLRKALFNAVDKHRLVSENRGLIQTLKTTNIALRQKIEDLDTMVYRASHDINGALARVLGLCEVAFKEYEKHPLNDYFAMIQKETNVLSHTLNNLMNLHDLNNYQVVPSTEFGEEFLKRCTKEVAAEFGFEPSVFRLLVDEGELHTDLGLLEIAITPLLQNALLYGKEKFPIEVELQLQKTQATFKVIDRGMGIEDAIQPKIYDKFFKGNGISPGNGLGLYIAAMAAQKLSGKILCRSMLHKKTTFTLVIPQFQTETA